PPALPRGADAPLRGRPAASPRPPLHGAQRGALTATPAPGPGPGAPGLGARTGAGRGQLTRLVSTEVNMARPSVPVRVPAPGSSGPKPASTACSGCGMSPTTLPAALVMPAMSWREPLGFCSNPAGPWVAPAA